MPAHQYNPRFFLVTAILGLAVLASWYGCAGSATDSNPADPSSIIAGVLDNDVNGTIGGDVVTGDVVSGGDPIVRSVGLFTAPETPITIQLSGVSPSGQPLDFAIVSPPAYGRLSQVEPLDDVSATVTYTPPSGFRGVAQFSYRASDGAGQSNVATVVVLVYPPVYFELDLYDGVPPLTVHGRASTMTDDPLPEGEYRWSWGDLEEGGAVETFGERAHTFIRPGRYTVGLSILLAGVAQPIGCTNSRSGGKDALQAEVMALPTIAGQVRDAHGAPLAGATIATDDGVTTTSDSNGQYVLPVPYLWSGTVTPSLAGYTFAPPNRAYAQVNETLTGQDYDASAAPAPGVLGVAPADGLASSGYVGGPFTPATKQYTLTNTGGSPLTWTAGATQGWVTLSGTGGPLAAGASTSVTVTINSNANSLDAGSYGDTVTVTNATNGQGNTTRPVSLAVNPGSPGNCITSTSAWQNTSFASQSGAFTAEFDAIPSAPFSGADGVTALSATAGAQYSDYAVLVRFNDAGRIDARNGGTYGAVNVINYTGGTNYHFRLVVNVPAHTYSAYVTPQGAAEQVLALNYSFRTEQAGVVSLANWGLIGAAGWTHQVCNFVVSTSGAPLAANAGADKTITAGSSTTLDGAASGGQPPYTYSWSPATGLSDPTLAQPTASPAITTTYTLTVTDSEGDTAADGALVTVVVGNLYYVATNDPNASDSNPGTEALPWKTLTKAANTAQAGDTVLVRAGTYNESLTLTHSGTVDAPITFSNHNGAAVVIDGQHSRPSNVTVQNANYVIVSGFEMVHAASNAVVLQNTQHVQVLNNHVHDGDSRGIVLRQGSLGARIAYNEVNNMQDDPLMNWLEYNPSIRYDDTIIEHNYLHDCFVGHSDGIQWVAPSANTIIRYNVVADTTQNIYIAPDHLNVDSLEIYGNVVYNQNYNTWGKGIYVVATAGSDATITNVSIHSNTIGHHSVGWCVLLQGDLSNVSFRNNIFSTDGDSAINLANNADDPNQISLDYNLYWRPDVGANALIVWGGWYDTLAQFKSAHPGQEVHGVEANPLFVNESGHNYHLNASSSPAFNAGTNVGTGPDFDGWERPWSGGWDLGAFEYH